MSSAALPSAASETPPPPYQTFPLRHVRVPCSFRAALSTPFDRQSISSSALRISPGIYPSDQPPSCRLPPGDTQTQITRILIYQQLTTPSDPVMERASIRHCRSNGSTDEGCTEKVCSIIPTKTLFQILKSDGAQSWNGHFTARTQRFGEA